MPSSYLANMTDEERAENLAKARQARIDKKQWALANLKTEWDDDGHWTELAKKYNVKLPSRYDKAAAKYINRIVKQLGVPKELYEEYVGLKNGNEEARLNPTMNARAQAGLFLECVDEYLRKS